MHSIYTKYFTLSIYDTRTKLRKYKIYNDQDIEKLNKIYFKDGKQTEKDLGKMASALIPIINRYKELDEETQYEFRVTVRNFNKWYSYITQLTRMFDKELHEEYIFTSYLIKFIPRNKSDQVSIEDKIKLEYYKLEETFKGEIVLEKSSDYVLKNPEKIDTWIKPPEEEDTLENIIQRVNERFEGKFTESDRVIVEGIYKKAVKDNEKLRKFARNNDEEIFNKSIFPDVFEKVAQELYIEQMNAYSKLFEDRSFYNAVLDAVAKEAYKELRSE